MHIRFSEQTDSKFNPNKEVLLTIGPRLAGWLAGWLAD